MQERMQASGQAIDAAKVLYRGAIDARAADAEGESWWSHVALELAQVVAAPSIAAAADVISWWHHDWSSVSDTPRAAAGRIRAAGRADLPTRQQLLAGALCGASVGVTFSITQPRDVIDALETKPRRSA